MADMADVARSQTCSLQFFAKLLQAETGIKSIMFFGSYTFAPFLLQKGALGYEQVNRMYVMGDSERPPSKFALQHCAGFHCSGSSLGQGCRLGYWS